MKFFVGALAILLVLASKCAVTIEVDLTNPDSIKTAASTIAYDLMTYYTGNITGSQNWQGFPGILQLPYGTGAGAGGYYWWEGGGLWGTMIDYWYYTGDPSYNHVVTQALVFNANAPDNDFLNKNETASMGNDDQGFWAMSAMTAAEVNFPAPPENSNIPGWLALAQGVFNGQAKRWDDTSCGGGMRWQQNADQSGWTYKNSISNGVFFNVASRLALYTGNNTYYDWANKTYNWVSTIGLLNETTWLVFDGTASQQPLNCTQIDHDQWTYNVGIYLHGAANMYNYTSSLDDSDPRAADTQLWKARITALAEKGLPVFFPNGIMTEGCESSHCDNDQKSFKTFLARWMAATTKLAPFSWDVIHPKIVSSATAAALQCSGGVNAIGSGAGRQCGLRWSQNGAYDGDTGAGQQMAALEIIQANLITQAADTLTNSTGGTSQGDPNAGTSVPTVGPNGVPLITVTAGDRVGAAFVTLVIIIFAIVGPLFMLSPETINNTPGTPSRSLRKDWRWGDMSMSARMANKFGTQKGKGVDRNSIVLEKLNTSGANVGMGYDIGSSSMIFGPRGTSNSESGNGLGYGPGGGGRSRSDSDMDIYGTSPPTSRTGVGFYSPVFGNRSVPYTAGGVGGSSRPGSSRDVGAGFSDSWPGSARGRGPMFDGGVVYGRPVAS